MFRLAFRTSCRARMLFVTPHSPSSIPPPFATLLRLLSLPSPSPCPIPVQKTLHDRDTTSRNLFYFLGRGQSSNTRAVCTFWSRIFKDQLCSSVQSRKVKVHWIYGELAKIVMHFKTGVRFTKTIHTFLTCCGHIWKSANLAIVMRIRESVYLAFLT